MISKRAVVQKGKCIDIFKTEIKQVQIKQAQKIEKPNKKISSKSPKQTMGKSKTSVTNTNIFLNESQSNQKDFLYADSPHYDPYKLSLDLPISRENKNYIKVN